ncbi:hypothetical protein SFRURICE_009571 [Spodoptera frugiperda]|nr:hypothetical protein SFRURICE_009571 [Spodoptera frugiperda]
MESIIKITRQHNLVPQRNQHRLENTIPYLPVASWKKNMNRELTKKGDRSNERSRLPDMQRSPLPHRVEKNKMEKIF